MAGHDVLLERIRLVIPSFAISESVLNREGLINDVVIVNGEIVFRFPKTEWGQRSLAAEVRLLDAIGDRLPIPVPQPVLHDETMASHAMLTGEPLTREFLFRMPERHRAALLGQLGAFLKDLHEMPKADLTSIGRSDAERTRDELLAFYGHVEEDLFPLLYQHQRQSVRDLFAPVVSGRLELAVDPVLIHGDLAPYHILVNPTAPALTGIIDWGTAGSGDPAIDIATLLVVYGERIVQQMRPAYPLSVDLLGRARFRAACLELEWALAGVRDHDLSMLVAHIGGARDYPLPGLLDP